MTFARAPGRVEILGNHTDYHDGLVLAAAIDRTIVVEAERRADSRIQLRSGSFEPVEANLSQLAPVTGNQAWANYPLGVVRELAARGISTGGFSAQIESGLPAGAGLGSSAAVCIATALCLLKMQQHQLDPRQLARLCQRAEHRFAGVESGLLDQLTIIFGQTDHLLFFDARTEHLAALPFPAELSLVVALTDTTRKLAQGRYNERRRETFAAADGLGVKFLRDVSSAELQRLGVRLDPVLRRRAAHIIGENERVQRASQLLRQGGAFELGALMNESHESSRMNFENSAPELDRLVELARRQSGVLGARLTGGGFGGAIVALCETRSAAATAENLRGSCAGAFVCRPADGTLRLN